MMSNYSQHGLNAGQVYAAIVDVLFDHANGTKLLSERALRILASNSDTSQHSASAQVATTILKRANLPHLNATGLGIGSGVGSNDATFLISAVQNANLPLVETLMRYDPRPNLTASVSDRGYNGGRNTAHSIAAAGRGRVYEQIYQLLGPDPNIASKSITHTTTKPLVPPRPLPQPLAATAGSSVGASFLDDIRARHIHLEPDALYSDTESSDDEWE